MNTDLEREVIEALPFSVVLVDNELKVANLNSKAASHFGNIAGIYLYDTKTNLSKPEVIDRVDDVLTQKKPNSVVITNGITNHKTSLYSIDIQPVSNIEFEGALLLISESDANNHLHKEFNIIFHYCPIKKI